MRAKIFCDSNIFLYGIDELADSAKRGRCHDWLDYLAKAKSAVCNLQVVNEVTNVLLKKRRLIAPEQVFEHADTIALLGDQPIGALAVAAARRIHFDFRYSWWDCLLLASALELGCSHFLSEDLQDGQVIGGLTIINPFTHAPEEILGPVQE